MKKSTVQIALGTSIALAATGWSCLSMQSQTSIDGANNSVGTSNQPYVEAYIEYPGPQQKWAGPQSFILHVLAKDAGAAQITVTPQLMTTAPAAGHSENELSAHRTPAHTALSHASHGSGHGDAQGAVQAAPAHPMSSEQAREQLTRLVASLQGVQAPFRGCMSPVRVRLVRADGGILERQGCRSELGWSRAVSDSVTLFVDASINGVVPTAPKPVVQAQAATTAIPAARTPAAADAHPVAPTAPVIHSGHADPAHAAPAHAAPAAPTGHDAHAAPAAAHGAAHDSGHGHDAAAKASTAAHH